MLIFHYRKLCYEIFNKTTGEDSTLIQGRLMHDTPAPMKISSNANINQDSK